MSWVPSWHTGAKDAIPAVGGAMDLATGAKDVLAMMTLFAKDGSSKLVPTCTYPLTGVACVSRVYTDHGVFEVTDKHLRVREVHGATIDELRERTGLELLHP